MGGGKEHWAVRLVGEYIEESAWRGLADWVGQESRPSALHVLSELLEADLPLAPTTEELIEVRQDLARVELEALNDHARAAFDKLVGFLDMAIRRAKAGGRAQELEEGANRATSSGEVVPPPCARRCYVPI